MKNYSIVNTQNKFHVCVPFHVWNVMLDFPKLLCVS